MMKLVAGSQARAMSTNRAGSTGDVNPLPSPFLCLTGFSLRNSVFAILGFSCSTLLSIPNKHVHNLTLLVSEPEPFRPLQYPLPLPLLLICHVKVR